MTRTNHPLRRLSACILTPLLLAIPLGAGAQEEFKSDVTFSGPYPGELVESPAKARADQARGRVYDVNAIVITGDRVPVYSLPNWDAYENDALYEPMSEADIEAFRQRVLKDLQDEGYLFATVSVYRPSLKLGFLKVRIHVGEKGEVTVAGNRWFTAEQILDSVEWETGNHFNYRNLYNELFSLNVRPGMNVETELKPRVDADGKRVVDVEFIVEDRFPLHLAWNIANTGSKDTSDWRSRLTGQYVNLLKRQDVLTAEWVTDPENISDVSAFSGSYNLPINDKWAATVYAGFSESDLEDVLPELDILGKGWYAGFNVNRKLHDTKKYSIDLSFGWLFQNSEQTLVGFEERNVQMSMPRINLGYSAKEYDWANGRNFFSATLTANFEGQFGASGRQDSQAGNLEFDGDAVLLKFQAARFQKLFANNDRLSKWSMFFRVDGQVTNDSVPSSLYKSIGGADSVRGYPEREAVGDYGFNATVELRTPLFENFFPGMVRDEEYLRENPEDWKMHRLQAIAFYDVGWVAYQDRLDGSSTDDTSLHSVGVGLRLGFTKFSQMRFDWGYPLEDSPNSTELGNTHFSLQLQY